MLPPRAKAAFDARKPEASFTGRLWLPYGAVGLPGRGAEGSPPPPHFYPAAAPRSPGCRRRRPFVAERPGGGSPAGSPLAWLPAGGRAASPAPPRADGQEPGKGKERGGLPGPAAAAMGRRAERGWRRRLSLLALLWLHARGERGGGGGERGRGRCLPTGAEGKEMVVVVGEVFGWGWVLRGPVGDARGAQGVRERAAGGGRHPARRPVLIARRGRLRPPLRRGTLEAAALN